MWNSVARDARLACASLSVVKKIAAMEQLEGRRLLHAGHDHDVVMDPNNLNPSDGHISEAAFRAARPEFANVTNLWDPTVFNPNNTNDRSQWLYDPHAIEQDVAPVLPPAPVFSSPEAVQLPDLVALTSGSDLDPVLDTTEIPGHNLLRFTTAVGNAGTGPAILTSANSGTPPAGSGLTSWINPDGSQNVLQMKYNWTGSTFVFDSYRQAGRMVWHPGHGHFHLEGYASYRLLTNVGGNPGPVAIRSGFDGAPAEGDKVGFCLVNIRNSFVIPATGTSSSSLTGFNGSGQPSTSCGFLQGIHVGKADVYSSIYDGQWIDVTGVPNGNYFLEVTMDSLNVIEESNETNNTVLVPVTINASNQTGGAITPDRFEPNNNFGSATDLGELGVQTQPGLTAHVTGESDFFRFTAASSGTYSIQLVIADRDMNLYVYNSAQALLGSSSSDASGTSSNPTTETVNVNFVAGQTYYIRAQGFGSDLSPTTSGISSNYSLKINVNPTVNASTPDGSAGELGLTPGTVRLARNGPTSSPLAVNFTVAGTATRGVDYELWFDDVLVTGNSISIGNEASNGDLQVRPLADATLESSETVIITLNTSSAYVVGGTNAGTVTLHDTPPQVTADAFTFETLPQQLSFDFTLDVSASLAAADVQLINQDTREEYTPNSVSYNGALNRATFNVNSALPDGNYVATIAASAVTHALGEPLAADATATFFVFAGDANHDRSVNINDFAALAANFNQPGTFSQGNFNYDAAVDISDFALLASRFNTTLPAARRTPVAPLAEVRSASAPRNPFADGSTISRMIDELENEIVNTPV